MSNIYPEWWSDTVTIYNKTEDNQTHVVTWHRHTVSGVFWKYAGDKVTVGEVTLDTKNVICRLRRDDEHFREGYIWQALPNDEKPNFYTLQTGDIIVKGEVEDEIDEYTSGHRSTDFLKKYKSLQGCMEIEQVAINVGPGRGQEHYYTKGI